MYLSIFLIVPLNIFLIVPFNIFLIVPFNVSCCFMVALAQNLAQNLAKDIRPRGEKHPYRIVEASRHHNATSTPFPRHGLPRQKPRGLYGRIHAILLQVLGGVVVAVP